MFPNLTPAPYVYQEYPKMVYPEGGGEPVVVQSAEEEAALRPQKQSTLTLPKR